MDMDPLMGNHLDDFFHRGFHKPRMWTQYADQHRGVCLIFDRTKLAKAIENQLSEGQIRMTGPVEYVNRSILPQLSVAEPFTIDIDALESVRRTAYPQLHLQRLYKVLFFEKMVDCKHGTE
jgi:Protein of unknown function (DUF2971)